MSQVVCFPYFGDTVGGSHLSSLELIRRLPLWGYTPKVVLHTHGAFSDYLDALGIEYDCLERPVTIRSSDSIFATSVHAVRSQPALVAYLRRSAADVVHTNDNRMHQTWAIAARLSGVLHVRHQRTPFGVGSRQYRFLLSLPQHIVAISQYVANTCPPKHKQRLHVIDNPFSIPDNVNREASRDLILQEIGVTNAKPANKAYTYKRPTIIGMFANFHERKRPELALNVLARMSKCEPDAKDSLFLLFFGFYPQEAMDSLTRRAKELSIDNNVRFMGFRADPTSAMAGCDLVIATARREPFGRTLVEAMSVGTPVVATGDGGHLEIIQHEQNGYLVNPDDTEGFATTCCELLQSFERRREIGLQGLRSVRERFNADRHVQEVCTLYADYSRN